jgi:hypothetical protein
MIEDGFVNVRADNVCKFPSKPNKSNRPHQIALLHGHSDLFGQGIMRSFCVGGLGFDGEMEVKSPTKVNPA